MKISFNVTGFTLDTEMFEKLDLAKVVEKELADQRAVIIKRTQAGQRADGGKLKEYSEQYKDEIDSGHIFGKAPGNHTVNLTATGTLMRSMTTKVESVQGVHTGTMTFEGPHPGTIYVSKRSAEKKVAKAKGEKVINPNRGAGGYRTGRVGAARSAEVVAKYTGLARRPLSQVKGNKKFSPHPSGVTNRDLAEYQYAIGRGGWFAFSQEDALRVLKNITSVLLKASGLKVR